MLTWKQLSSCLRLTRPPADGSESDADTQTHTIIRLRMADVIKNGAASRVRIDSTHYLKEFLILRKGRSASPGKYFKASPQTGDLVYASLSGSMHLVLK